jgi:hypothetical protein
LYADLIEEWMPIGATETEAVFSLANAMWRKRRARLFLEVQLMKNSINVNHASFDESLGLLSLMASMEKNPKQTAFEKYAKRTLRQATIDYLLNKFPFSNFESESDWAKAIIQEVKLLLPAKLAGLTDEPSELPDELRESDAARLVHKVQELTRKVTQFGGHVASGDIFERHLALDERLDAMIDRAVKRLVQIKAMKQMLGQASAQPPGNEMRKIVARTTSTS